MIKQTLTNTESVQDTEQIPDAAETNLIQDGKRDTE